MIQQFIEKDYKIVEFDEFADIYIVNTCTVTNISDRKARKILRRCKIINKDCILVATGCYAQVAENELKQIEEIDLIVGNNEKNNIVEIVEKKLNIVTDIMKSKDFLEYGAISYAENARAFIKVQDGCNNFCSYCIIPYARGRVRSRKIDNILEEIKKLVKENITEVVITGIHIASFGKDFEEDITLIDLLEEIQEIEGIERIRLGSLEPTIITEEFIKRLKKLNKICNHFHLSLQSGDNDTLERMNRKYTTEQFENSVELLRKNYLNVALTTDIIAGFPGETEKEFENTYNFLKKINFYQMHIFKYSRRTGTKANLMKEQINPKIKEIRSAKLLELSKQNEQDYMFKYLNKEIAVLFETRENDCYIGHTTNYLTVKIKSNSDIINNILTVKIVEIENNILIGKKPLGRRKWFLKQKNHSLNIFTYIFLSLQYNPN